jgi:phosphate:Na+ symporter
MAGHTILLNLLGGVALLIWATRVVRTGVIRGFGEGFRRALSRATANPLAACLTGMAVAAAVQSSSATGLIAVSFAERGLLGLAPGLAVMLGADVGSTLVVQALSFSVGALVPILLVAGVSLFMLASSPRVTQIGRILVGLALMIVALGMVVAASRTLRENDVLALVLHRLADDPVIALIIGALIAWLSHSSVATVLLIASMAGADALPPVAAGALVLGANVGSGLVPLGLSLRSSIEARRILVGNLAFRLLGALLALGWIGPAMELLARIDADPGRLVANAHTAFNLAVAVLFLPLTPLAARWLERLMVPPAKETGQGPLAHLDEELLDRPAMALGAATRAVMQVADRVEFMLREVIHTFEEQDDRRANAVRGADNEVDALQEEVKLYLTRLTRHKLDEEDARRAFDLILFTTNLEHIGDIVDKNLLELAAKKRRLHLAFSEEGWEEITAMHRRIVDQMRLAMTVFVTRDPKMARDLVIEKDRLRQAERAATQSHLERLRQGKVQSIETSALHLDILRDLKRINAHVTSVAYPILEATGELQSSRLRSEPRAGLANSPAE